ncbi:TetR family transcriptional regulator [Clostridium sp. HCP1S3_B4]|nr:helix-turn-helix transcriptional regulator [Clostridiales bacterium]
MGAIFLAYIIQIVEVLGITKGALYRHYQNKRDIFIILHY